MFGEILFMLCAFGKSFLVHFVQIVEARLKGSFLLLELLAAGLVIG